MKCDLCAREATRRVGEMGDYFVCEGHAKIMEGNRLSHEIDTEDPEELEGVYRLWRRGREWLRDNPID